jgi:hypothetical protein
MNESGMTYPRTPYHLTIPESEPTPTNPENLVNSTNSLGPGRTSARLSPAYSMDFTQNKYNRIILGFGLFILLISALFFFI